MPLAPGSRLGPYEIVSHLGAGGMGEVYRALDIRLRRTVAIKVLPRDKVRSTDSEQRFLNEARAASALNHPNIVTLYDIASEPTTEGSLDFLVMEYVPGEALSRAIPRNGLALFDLVEYATQMASALATAHAAGIVHRDIKPANVILTPARQMKILDFGLAKLQYPEAGENDETRKWAHTEPGVVLGTVAYMSPEQARGEPVDARTDLFSAGAVLYEMATGRRAFLKALDWTRPSTPTRHPDLDRLILKLLEPDRELRYQTAADLLADLKRLQTSLTSGVSRRQWLWAAGLVAVVAGVVGAGLQWRHAQSPAQESRLSDGNRPSANREANDYYERALLFGGGGIEDNAQRLRMLERALALDPKFAAARAEYAFGHIVMILQGNSNDSGLFYKTEEQIRQALQDDPGCGRAHSVLALTYLLQGRKELVRAEVDKALKANPEDITAHTWRLQYDRLNGDYPEAIREAEELITRWPLYWPGHLYLGLLLREQGDTAAAAREQERVLEQDPRNTAALSSLARAYIDAAKLNEARLALSRVRPEDRQNYSVRLDWALLLASEGKRAEAAREMDGETQAWAALWSDNMLRAAEVYAVMGDTATALEWLDRAVRAGDDREAWLRLDPLLANIRTHPDFQKMLGSVAFRRQQRSPTPEIR